MFKNNHVLDIKDPVYILALTFNLQYNNNQYVYPRQWLYDAHAVTSWKNFYYEHSKTNSCQLNKMYQHTYNNVHI